LADYQARNLILAFGKVGLGTNTSLGASAMILMKKSPSDRPNPKLREEKPQKDEGNKKWLARHDATEGVILLGGALIPDFRIRVAQSERATICRQATGRTVAFYFQEENSPQSH
jgi:hypothetical protein